MLCLDPVQSSLVLSVFNLSLLADIQRPTSMMHYLSRVAAVAMSSRQQCVSFGKRVKSDTVSVDNVRKVSPVQHQQYWAKD